MIVNHNDRDSANRAFNEVATAKHLVLTGALDDEVLRHLDAALSWCLPLLGVEHPMVGAVAPASLYVPLDLKDRFHLGLES